MMKEYMVTKEILNIRSKPSDESDDTFIGQLLQGETVWLHDTEITGTIPKGGTSNKWLGDESMRVVSKEGVALKNYEYKKEEFLKNKTLKNLHNNSNNENDWKINWGHVYLDIWKLWNHPDFPTKGENVNIAVIDTGIAIQNPDLTNAIKETFYAPTDGGNIIDTIGHGTKCSGLISATGESLIYGIAPLSKIFIAKKRDIIGQQRDIYHEKAFQWILDVDKKNKIDIISMSFTCAQTPTLDKALKEFNNRGILVVAAAGDAGMLEDDMYPACFENVISIASLSKNLQRQESSSYNSNTKFILPGEKLLTTGISNNDRFHSDTSAATPVFAGILALLISLKNRKLKNFTNDTLLNALYKTGYNISENIDGEIRKWKLPQPLIALSKL